MTSRLRSVVAGRAERLQVVEAVDRAALAHRDDVVNLEAFRLAASHAAVAVAGQGSRSGRPPLRRRVGAAVWLGAKARARPAFLAAPTWPSGVPDPAALRAEEGKAHLCRPRSADSKLLFGVATLGNNLAVASARPQSRAHRGSESPRLLPGAQTAKAAAHQRALACSAGAYPKRKKSPLAAVFESWRAHLQPHG